MVLDCWVIILILAIAAYMFVRRGGRVWAPGVLPLMIVPLVTILYSPVGRLIVARTHSFSRAHLIRLALYIVAFAVACVTTRLFARRLPRGRNRYVYFISSVVFSLILILLFMIKIRY